MEEIEFIDCRTSVTSKVNRYAAVSLFAFVGFILLFCGLFLVGSLLGSSSQPAMRVIVTILCIVLAFFASYDLFRISAKVYRFEKRKIALDQRGIIIKDREDRQCLWDQISGVGIIAFAATANRKNYDAQICIFFEPIDQRDLKKLRDSYLYGARNLNKFVLMDYGPALADTIGQYSSLSIQDFRQEQLHKYL